MDKLLVLWVEAVSSPSVIHLLETISMIDSLEISLGMIIAISVIVILKKSNVLLKFVFQRGGLGNGVSYMEAFGYSFELVSYVYPSDHTMRMALFRYCLLKRGIQNH
ncbi:MAG: hypothetical protein ACI35P_17620 [Bacillus sp. (in: firmicutes)]